MKYVSSSSSLAVLALLWLAEGIIGADTTAGCHVDENGMDDICHAKRSEEAEQSVQTSSPDAHNTTEDDSGHYYRRPRVCRDVASDCAERLSVDGTTTNVCIDDFVELRDVCARTCKICSPDDPTASQIATDHRTRFTVDRIFATTTQILQGDRNFETLARLRETEDYMYNIVYPPSGAHSPSNRTAGSFDETVSFNEGATRYSSGIRAQCQLRHELCTYWAASGECTRNPEYMNVDCAPACRSCLYLDYRYRCGPLHAQPGPTAMADPGALHRMFESIVADDPVGRVQVVSRPTPGTPTTDDDVLDDGDAPWVIVLDDFLTSDECAVLIAQAADRGYKKSGQNGAVGPDGSLVTAYSDYRTSSTTWCKGDCYHHDVSQAVHERIEALTGVPRINYEYLQFLKYEKGEHYKKHHDYSDYMLERPPGARILTVYMYLNDVPAGGGTRFPNLDLTVMPKQGRVVIWPSVLNSNTSAIDMRTEHEALPVEEGTKYGANAWIHQRDFKSAHAKKCVK